MSDRRVIFFCMATALGALSGSGCTITNCDQGAVCLDEDDDSVAHQCSQVCERFAECGRIEKGQRGECVDACVESFHKNEDLLEDYCECVPETSCRDVTRECGRPPFTVPPVGDDDAPDDAGAVDDDDEEVDAGSKYDAGLVPGAALDAGPVPDANTDAGPAPSASADTGADGSAGAGARSDAAAGTCTCDDDCADSEGCLSGQCRARCTASCECRLGDVCEQGLCVPPPPVSMSCENDCDCPAGNHCVASVCTAQTAPSVQ